MDYFSCLNPELPSKVRPIDITYLEYDYRSVRHTHVHAKNNLPTTLVRLALPGDVNLTGHLSPTPLISDRC